MTDSLHVISVRAVSGVISGLDGLDHQFWYWRAAAAAAALVAITVLLTWGKTSAEKEKDENIF